MCADGVLDARQIDSYLHGLDGREIVSVHRKKAADERRYLNSGFASASISVYLRLLLFFFLHRERLQKKYFVEAARIQVKPPFGGAGHQWLQG